MTRLHRRLAFVLGAGAVLLSLGWPERGGAQTDSARKDSAVSPAGVRADCDSVLRAARVDSVEAQLRAYLLRTDKGQLPARVRSALIQILLANFVVPRPLQMPIFGAGPARLRMLRPERLEGDEPSARAPALYGVYNFRLRRSGRVDSVHVEIPSLAPGFDSSIVRAVRAGAADSALGPVFKTLKTDAVDLQLRLTSGADDGRLRTPAHTVFVATFPRIRLTDAQADPRNLPPQFPMLERVAGADGEVLVRVVIDIDGTALMRTAEVLHSTSPLFTLSALKALSAYRFTPARVGQCAVPQVIEIPFWFSLRP